jgi:hypothetical protein
MQELMQEPAIDIDNRWYIYCIDDGIAPKYYRASHSNVAPDLGRQVYQGFDAVKAQTIARRLNAEV